MFEDKSIEFRIQLQKRTKDFALRIIKMYQSLPNSGEAKVIGKQVLRSGTSIAANYRAACRARSSNEFYSKMSIVVEENDETLFWLELLVESNIMKKELMNNLISECEEILRIMSSIRKQFSK